MNKQFKRILIILAVFVSLLSIRLFLGSVFMYADFYSNPSEKECVRMAEKFLGCKLGKHYQFLDYDADYSHPDRPLSFFVNIPTENFRAIIDFCYEEAEKKDKKSEACSILAEVFGVDFPVKTERSYVGHSESA